MTEKQYKLERWTDTSLYYSFPTGSVHQGIGYVIEKVEKDLNQLADENEQLFNFKENVFNSIDGKIKRGEQAIEWGESIGADVGAMGFHIELLKQLKKELME